MNKFHELVENSQIEKQAKMEGRNLTMFLSPKQK